MKLVIAEKPQLAQVISDALGIVARKDGYFECQNLCSRSYTRASNA